MGGNGAQDNGKNEGRWTDEEHAKFLEALQLYGKNWNKVHKHVGTRNSAQTRSHAQKYFNKLMRKGTKEAHEQLQLLTRKDSLLNTNMAATSPTAAGSGVNKTSIDESTADGSANQNCISSNEDRAACLQFSN